MSTPLPFVDTDIVREDIDAILAVQDPKKQLPWEELTSRRVLVTGASGMIPAYTAAALFRANQLWNLNIDVTLLVRDADKARLRFGSLLDAPHVHLCVGDVTDVDLGDQRFDVIFHGASPARPSLHAHNPVGTLKTNALGTLHMLDHVADGGRFVLMSSSEVYGAHSGTELIGEHDFGPLDPYSVRGCYFEGKRMSETAVAIYAEQYGIVPTVVRFGHIYGPGMAVDDGRVQADFAADVAAGRDIVLTGDGTAQRTYTYVADAVSGMLLAMFKGTQAVYNIADPRGSVSIRQLADAFVAARPELKLAVRFANGEPPRGVSAQARLGLDSQALIDLGWVPSVDLASGAARMVGALSR
ncbi:NAD-dependent epimerase/dehydratase family protein [Schaalia sp. ZJ1691]|uniref:NAD-dependent epimerase/dehydratase family protein n=1 Tax=Schaalia sp. ZJ1691 TaxID=2709404 RepID=UPI0013EDDA0C|nr:NAD-dependent epimerase/dehydratase family protein [Schaalia sp. ZJ1691]